MDEHNEPDLICEECNKPMIKRDGKFGKFMACSGFPKCKNTKTIKTDADEGAKVQCPKCQRGEISIKRTKSERTFYGCSRYPSCNFVSWKKPTQK